MSKPTDGGPAFPYTDPFHGEVAFGMTLRDWFAGQALMSMLSPFSIDNDGTHTVATAARAYRFADAMLAARTPSPTPTDHHPYDDGPETADDEA